MTLCIYIVQECVVNNVECILLGLPLVSSADGERGAPPMVAAYTQLFALCNLKADL